MKKTSSAKYWLKWFIQKTAEGFAAD